MSSGATRTTRTTGERDSLLLWDVIVKCDDICFTHILPRLNANDVKFLYGVNTETRKLIKRSSRESDLKKGFKVREMSSISTLCGRIIRCGRYTGAKDLSARKLLERINSSCSSGREKRKSVSGVKGRLMRPHLKVIWKW